MVGSPATCASRIADPLGRNKVRVRPPVRDALAQRFADTSSVTRVKAVRVRRSFVGAVARVITDLQSARAGFFALALGARRGPAVRGAVFAGCALRGAGRRVGSQPNVGSSPDASFIRHAAPTPASAEVLWGRFIERHGFPAFGAGEPSVDLLGRLCRRFSEVVPYENVTQFLQRARCGAVPRTPRWFVAEHLEAGTGGTAFALAHNLRDFLGRYGFRAELCLGCVGAGPVTYFRPNHAAILVTVTGCPHLVDPGLMLRGPVRVPAAGESRIDLAVREAALRFSRPEVGTGEPDMLHGELSGAGGFQHRLSVELSTTGAAYFMRTWRQSFDPIAPGERLFISRFVREKLWTLENRVFTIRGPEGPESSRWVTVAEAAFLFGLPRAHLEEAYALTPFSRRRARIEQRIRFRLRKLQARRSL